MKEACNCQSLLGVKLFIDHDDEFQFEEPDCPHHRVQLHLQKLLVPHLRGRVVDGLGRLKITLISLRTEIFFPYNISFFWSHLGSLKMKYKLSEEAVCPYHLLLYELTIKHLFAEEKNLLAQGISLYFCQVDTIFPSLFYGLDYEVCQTLSTSFFQKNVVEGQ